MSSDVQTAPVENANAQAQSSTTRLGLLVLLLAVETSLVIARHWWSQILGDEIRNSAKFALSFAIAVVVFAGGRFVRHFSDVSAEVGRDSISGRILVIQLLAFAAYLLLTHNLLSHEMQNSPDAMAWLVVRVAFAAVVFGIWCGLVLPAKGWRLLIPRVLPDLGPLFAVVAIAWVLSRYSEGLWEDLTASTFAVVEQMLRLFYPVVLTEPGTQLIGTPEFQVTVGARCAGYEGLGLVGAALTAYIWLSRETLRFPAALFLLPLALAASLILNVVRIALLIAIGTWGYPDTAIRGFHTQAGWIAFNLIVLGTIALSRWSGLFHREAEPEPEAARISNPAAPFLMPLMVLVGMTMLSGALSSGGPDQLYFLRVLTTGGVLWAYYRSYRGLGWGWSGGAAAIGLAVFGLWIGLEYLLPPEQTEEDLGTSASMAGMPLIWFIARVIGAVIIVPFAEELAFRGYLLRRLGNQELNESPECNWFAVLVSSTLFGLLHADRWLAGTLAGMLFAWAFYRRGRLADAIIAHAVTNALLAAYVLLTRQWALW